jgi:DNA invertase Pin-like site-specific DNA recombinase
MAEGGPVSKARDNCAREGRERAQAKGVRMGRRPKLTHHQRQEALARRDAGETIVDIARSYAVHHSTISRL